MFCIQLIWKTGGSTTIKAATLDECEAQAAARQKRMGKNILAATWAYEVFKGLSGLYDVSIPIALRATLSEEALKAYLQAD